jgi:hypothetical protein
MTLLFFARAETQPEAECNNSYCGHAADADDERTTGYRPLWGRILLGGGFEFGDKLQKLWVGAEGSQIVVRHQFVGVLIPAINGLAQILQGFIGTVRSRRNASEGEPYSRRISPPFGGFLFFDHVMKKFLRLGVAMEVRHCSSHLLKAIESLRMPWPESATLDLK